MVFLNITTCKALAVDFAYEVMSKDFVDRFFGLDLVLARLGLWHDWLKPSTVG